MEKVQKFFSNVQFYLLEWDKLVIPPIWFLISLMGILAAVHALLNKRDPRAALGWTAVCLFFPGLGTVAYLLFGINRIKSRARLWHSRGRWEFNQDLKRESEKLNSQKHSTPFDSDTFNSLVSVSDSVSTLPLVKGCQIQILFNGEEAYPEMLRALDEAQERIFLGTYIFETNTIGIEFVNALAKALKRGVDVRVLVDGAGTKYSKPRIQKLLKKNDIPFALFLPLTFSPRSIHLNLRTHRKILVVDGKVGFTGGMNIGGRHLVKDPNNKSPTQDIHFKVGGPIVAQLQDAFLVDWYFAKEERSKVHYPCSTEEKGQALMRGIIAGPNEDIEKIKWIANGAISCAKQRVRIMTPYFIPDAEMSAVLTTAALRGVEVEVILPEKNNLPYVKWASQALFEELLHYGVRVYYQPPPFAHSKFMVIDDFYSLVGSANLDPRSLILNFEFNLEVYDHQLAGQLIHHFEEVRKKSRAILPKELLDRSFPQKFRDSVAKLFSPYF